MGVTHEQGTWAWYAVSVQISKIKLPMVWGVASTNHTEWQTESDVSITFLN